MWKATKCTTSLLQLGKYCRFASNFSNYKIDLKGFLQSVRHKTPSTFRPSVLIRKGE